VTHPLGRRILAEYGEAGVRVDDVVIAHQH